MAVAPVPLLLLFFFLKKSVFFFGLFFCGLRWIMFECNVDVLWSHICFLLKERKRKGKTKNKKRKRKRKKKNEVESEKGLPSLFSYFIW